jgi:hypothetical protein
MLFVPKQAARPLPAIVTAHPGTTGFGTNKGPDGLYGSKTGRDERFVTIQRLIRGHRPDAPDIPFNHSWWGPLDDRGTSVGRLLSFDRYAFGRAVSQLMLGSGPRLPHL